MTGVAIIAGAAVVGFVVGCIWQLGREERRYRRRTSPWHVAVRPSYNNGAVVEVKKRGRNDVLTVAEIKSHVSDFSEQLAEARAVAEERADDLNAMEI